MSRRWLTSHQSFPTAVRYATALGINLRIIPRLPKRAVDAVDRESSGDDMSLQLHNYTTVPPGGYRYLQPETKVWVSAPSWEDLLTAVRNHRRANNLPIGQEFTSEVESQLCANLPPEICSHDRSKSKTWRGPLTLEELLRGTGTLISWFLDGMKKVLPDEADRRAAICGSCHFNQNFQGCTSCNQTVLHKLTEKITGSQKTKHDGLLQNCTICGCSNKAAVWLPLDVLQENTPAEINDDFPEWCWKKKI